MKKLKILFINSIDSSDGVQTRYPPLGIGYLCTSLRKRLSDVDFEFNVLSDLNQEALTRFSPDIVGISSVSQNFNRAIASARLARKAGKPVLCGGVHISMLPNSLTNDMDVGIIGEGEETVCDLVGLFLAENNFQPEHLQKIPGIVYRQADGKLLVTEPRPLIASLDTIGMPARDLFPVNSETYMFTSRGCPYRCSFCASSRFWNTVRFFSAEYVVNEITLLINVYGVKEINFYDDLFALDIQRVKDIRDGLKKRKLLGKVEFACAMRANLVTKETVGLLKEIGVKRISMGLESGCQRTLDYLKQNVDIKDNERAVRIIKRHGLDAIGSFIIGSPQEEEKDILETFEFIKRNDLALAAVYLLTPFPGTPVWDYALQKGLVGENMDWNKLSVSFADNRETFIVLSEKLSRAQLSRLFTLIDNFIRQRSRKREFWRLIKRGIRHPFKIPGYVVKKLNRGEKK